MLSTEMCSERMKVRPGYPKSRSVVVFATRGDWKGGGGSRRPQHPVMGIFFLSCLF